MREESAQAGSEYDVVVIGAGAVGENAADRASRTGLRVALVEEALVGGECSYWACMPSKALLHPGQALAAAAAAPGAPPGVSDPVDVHAVLARRDEVAHHWDDADQARWVAGAGLTLLRGHARFTGPRALHLESAEGDVELRARHAVVIATGSAPTMPAVPGLRGVLPWTSRQATSAHTVPERLAIIGGGVIAVEMATAYADLGAVVTVLVRGERLLERAEPFAAAAVSRALVARGVRVVLGASATQAWRDDAGDVHLLVVHSDLVGVRTRGTGPATVPEDLVVDEVLVATGRRPATDDLGLEALGLTPGDAVPVDDAMSALGVDGGWLFAVGDVTGRTTTTHQGKYDARVCGDVIAARFGPDGGEARAEEAGAGPWSRYRASADAVASPQVVFTRPQVAWVGRTEADARHQGIEVTVLSYDLADLAGATVISPEYAGRAQLVVDSARDVVIGATFVGPDVGEMLHAATVAVAGEVPLDRLWHAVPAYPTVSEVWLRLLEQAGR